MDYWSLMVGGGGQGWLNAALLIGLFWAALGHPDRIRSIKAFRIATVLLGVSMVTPVISQAVMMVNQAGGPSTGLSSEWGTAMFATAVSPVLTMLAVIVGVDSVTPRPESKNQ